MHDRTKWRTIPGFTQIGNTGKTRGREGELKLFIDEAYAGVLENARFLFIEVDGNPVPLRIEWLRDVGDILIKFEDIGDVTTARTYASARVLMPSDEVPPATTGQPPDHHMEYGRLTGYILEDVHHGVLGEILEVREYPQQEMAVVLYEDKEILIPLNPEFVRKIEADNHMVFVVIPEGLLEL